MSSHPFGLLNAEPHVCVMRVLMNSLFSRHPVFRRPNLWPQQGTQEGRGKFSHSRVQRSKPNAPV